MKDKNKLEAELTRLMQQYESLNSQIGKSGPVSKSLYGRIAAVKSQMDKIRKELKRVPRKEATSG